MLLLDTHTFLWFASGSEMLRPQMVRLIETTESVVVSVVSLWEISLKYGLGKLQLDVPLDALFTAASSERIATLPLSTAHLLKYAQLPMHHKDPFDRMLAAQALVEGAVVASRDVVLDKYDVTRTW